KSATSAVEMATVNPALGPGRLAAANVRFSAMERAFAALLESERRGARAEVESAVRQGRVGLAVISLAGVLTAALLLLVTLALARLLARSLETQLEALTDLGLQAGARVPVEGADEVDRIARAIAAFRTSLLRQREHETELASANEGLRSSEARYRLLFERN